HPFATRRQTEVRAAVRLACVRHSASVQSEPGSNSSVQSLIIYILFRYVAAISKEEQVRFSRKSFLYFHFNEHLIHFAPSAQCCRASGSRHGHQAPTLIGC